jgi:very-short-patch-repair endonuclease
VPPALRGRPFTRQTALRLISADQLRHASYRRLTRDVYFVGQPAHGDKIRAARLVLPASAVLVGLSALWALGVELADDAPVEVRVPARDRPRRSGLLRVTSERVAEREVVRTSFGRATNPSRTAFDLARRGDALASVPLLDALVRRTGVDRRSVEAVAAAHPGVRWSTRVVPALDLVDARAESVRESMLRVTLAAAGLPRPVCQLRIFDGTGMFVARVDLAWPELRVAVEYDGRYHDDLAQYARDRARLNALRAAGWTVIVIDRAQLSRPDDVVEMIRRLLATASAARA